MSGTVKHSQHAWPPHRISRSGGHSPLPLVISIWDGFPSTHCRPLDLDYHMVLGTTCCSRDGGHARPCCASSPLGPHIACWHHCIHLMHTLWVSSQLDMMFPSTGSDAGSLGSRWGTKWRLVSISHAAHRGIPVCLPRLFIWSLCVKS